MIYTTDEMRAIIRRFSTAHPDSSVGIECDGTFIYWCKAKEHIQFYRVFGEGFTIKLVQGELFVNCVSHDIGKFTNNNRRKCENEKK